MTENESGDAGKGKIQADAANKEKKGQTALRTDISAKLQGATGALVQVSTSDAACFQAGLTDVKKSDGVQFEAKVPKDGGGGGDSPDSLCNENLCAADDAIAQQCEDFLDLCLTVEEVNEDECAGGAVIICEGGIGDPDVDPGNVCSRTCVRPTPTWPTSARISWTSASRRTRGLERSVWERRGSSAGRSL